MGFKNLFRPVINLVSYAVPYRTRILVVRSCKKLHSSMLDQVKTELTELSRQSGLPVFFFESDIMSIEFLDDATLKAAGLMRIPNPQFGYGKPSTVDIKNV